MCDKYSLCRLHYIDAHKQATRFSFFHSIQRRILSVFVSFSLAVNESLNKRINKLMNAVFNLILQNPVITAGTTCFKNHFSKTTAIAMQAERGRGV
jgi:hypothetical protein